MYTQISKCVAEAATHCQEPITESFGSSIHSFMGVPKPLTPRIVILVGTIQAQRVRALCCHDWLFFSAIDRYHCCLGTAVLYITTTLPSCLGSDCPIVVAASREDSSSTPNSMTKAWSSCRFITPSSSVCIRTRSICFNTQKKTEYCQASPKPFISLCT